MQEPAHGAQAQSGGSAGSLARRLYEAYNAHRSGDAAALYRNEGCHLEVSSGRVARGPAEIAAGLDGFFALFADARWEPLQEIYAAGAAAVSYRLTGSLGGPLGETQPRGQRLNLRGVHLLRVDGAAIGVSEDYWDQATFRAQMSAPGEGG
jgi:hypothetical protein